MKQYVSKISVSAFLMTSFLSVSAWAGGVTCTVNGNAGTSHSLTAFCTADSSDTTCVATETQNFSGLGLDLFENLAGGSITANVGNDESTTGELFLYSGYNQTGLLSTHSVVADTSSDETSDTTTFSFDDDGDVAQSYACQVTNHDS